MQMLSCSPITHPLTGIDRRGIWKQPSLGRLAHILDGNPGIVDQIRMRIFPNHLLIGRSCLLFFPRLIVDIANHKLCLCAVATLWKPGKQFPIPGNRLSPLALIHQHTGESLKGNIYPGFVREAGQKFGQILLGLRVSLQIVCRLFPLFEQGICRRPTTTDGQKNGQNPKSLSLHNTKLSLNLNNQPKK